MFFSYGPLKDVLASPLDNVHLLGISVGPQKVLFLTWLAAWLLLGRWLRRAAPGALATASIVLNRSALTLVLIGSATAALTWAGSGRAPELSTWPRDAQPSARSSDDPGLPDIYYIILDDYARGDTLRDVYGFDNSPFLGWLRTNGFYVADESRANYLQTSLSLASSLNSTYLDGEKLADATPRWHIAVNPRVARYLDPLRRPLLHMIQYSSVVRALRGHGYRFVALTSGFAGVQLPNADLVVRMSALSDFQDSLIEMTPLSELERFHDPIDLHRRHVLYALDHLGDAFGGRGPRFVFAHILSPHPPFIFDANGQPRSAGKGDTSLLMNDVAGTPEADRARVAAAYLDQVRFVNSRVQAALAAILSRSGKPPIIILQSDHGSNMLLDWDQPSMTGLEERAGILNAFYVPAKIRERLYPGISPVNTFRAVLGCYFPGAYELLSDETYYSPYRAPFDFVHVDWRRAPADRAAR
jgi:hypothetical protein